MVILDGSLASGSLARKRPSSMSSLREAIEFLFASIYL